MNAIKKEYLSQTVVCQSSDSAVEVAQVLRDTAARHLIVLEDQKPVGIISVVDIVHRIVGEEKDYSTQAKEFMTKDMITIDTKASIEDAIEKMSQQNISSLPVTHDEKLVGVLEFTKALQALANLEQEMRKGE